MYVEKYEIGYMHVKLFAYLKIHSCSTLLNND